MCRKLIYLFCFGLVLGMFCSAARADIETGLVGYWPLDEGTGTATVDASGSGHDGTLHNGATWLSPGFIGNAAIAVDGNPGSRVSLGTWDPGQRLTLAIWARWTGEQTKAARAGLIGKRDSWAADGLRWFVEVTTAGQVRMRNYSQTVSSPAGALTAFIDQWAHVTVTFDGATARIYLNGEEVGSGAFSLGSLETAAMGLGCKAGGSDSNNEIFSGDIDDARIYSRALNAADVKQLSEWTGILRTASNPAPADGQTDVSRDATLSWTPGADASRHDVYFGTSYADVEQAAATTGAGGVYKGRIDPNSYNVGRLEFGQTCYWRVDEVEAPPGGTIHAGSVWSFTAEPLAYPVTNVIATASSSAANKGPENTVNGSGLDAGGLHGNIGDGTMWLSDAAGPQPTWILFEFDRVHKLQEMWVWNSNESLEPMVGLGFKDVTIEYSADGVSFTTLGTTHEFAQGTGAAGYAHNTTIDMAGVPARYVRLTANSNWKGWLPQFGLSEVQFFYTPVTAREPSPDSGAADVGPDVTLGWRAGREAARHDLYLSTDELAVMEGTVPAVAVAGASYGPTALDLDSTYYWRVDEVNDTETPTTWQGDVWSFSTPAYLVVDDFESYNDIDPPNPESNRIFEAWVDGYGVASNGALVGNDLPPYAEQTIVRGGYQSMPLFYNNTAGATYSEAKRTFGVPQDWTKHGISTLVLYFQGTPGNTGKLYAKVNGVKVMYPGDAADLARLRWKQWNIDLASLGVALQNVTSLTLGIDGNGAAGTLYIDDLLLYRLAPDAAGSSEEIWIEAEAAAPMTAPLQIYDDPTASGGKYISTDESVGDNNANPPADGIASYTFTVLGGTYKVSGRIRTPDTSNSFWVRIQGATIPAETELHSSGWVRWNDPPPAESWFWSDVFSDDDDRNAIVLFTMNPGTYTLEIARREDGAQLDVLAISKAN